MSAPGHLWSLFPGYPSHWDNLLALLIFAHLSVNYQLLLSPPSPPICFFILNWCVPGREGLMTLPCRFPQTFETGLEQDGQLSPATAKPWNQWLKNRRRERNCELTICKRCLQSNTIPRGSRECLDLGIPRVSFQLLPIPALWLSVRYSAMPGYSSVTCKMWMIRPHHCIPIRPIIV